jgi:leucyl/phenylalanyl-tRNA--protein transferase
MPITAFPNVSKALPSGLLAVGGDLSVPSLLLAYSSGIFPWPHTDEEILWFAPPERTILPFDVIRVPHSLKKEVRRKRFTTTKNQAFSLVIQECSKLIHRGDQEGTWITPGMIEAYNKLHHAGFAISYETWHDGTLVGGMYGVRIGRFFAGESMFYRMSNASKIAFLFAVEDLKKGGVTWIDCQTPSNFINQLGGITISRRKYGLLLKEAIPSDGAGST